jgi:hypothetical protein
MDITAWEQNITRKKAIESFIAMAIALALQFIIRFLDRKTQGFVNFFAFWPLVVFALIQAIGVVVYYIKHFRITRITYLLLTIPVYAFLVYLVITIVA